MAVLVMDTATEACAVAVGREDDEGQIQMLASTAIRVPRSHSRRLQPAIAQVLEHAGLEMSDLHAVGVGLGPGSYTGVRIAVSTAKAMAYALDLPLHPIDTLAGLAASVLSTRPAVRSLALPLIYARRGRAFGAVYAVTPGDADADFPASLTCLVEPMVLPVTAWRSRLTEATSATDERTQAHILHDFQPRYGLADEIAGMARDASAAVVSLAEAAGNFGQGLLRAFTLSAAVTGAAMHEVEPTYLLQTEAETKLAGGESV